MLHILADKFYITNRCHVCKKDTEWEVQFLAYYVEHHTVAFATICCDCQEKHPEKKYLRAKLNIEYWLETIKLLDNFLEDN